MTQPGFRCGLVALVGRPNVGKSTLLNQLLGEKLSIVSPKAQTTRNRIRGILNQDDLQLILVDTPGVPRGKTALHRLMRRSADAAASDADLTLVIVEPKSDEPAVSSEDAKLVESARRSGARVIVLLNKVDRIRPKQRLLPWIQAYSEGLDMETVLPISAKTGEGLDALRPIMEDAIPEGPPLFPTDLHTDQAERFICGELVREQVLLQTQQEVPHSATVFIEDFEDLRDRPEKPLCRIFGRIIVERDSQKPIVIGKRGRRIKAIGEASRPAIEELLDSQVYLKLTVHVDPNWTDSQRALRLYGLDMDP